MFKNFRDKIAVSGIAVLAVGVALLIFTFISAYGFLAAGLSIITSNDLVQTFGTALAPLIGTCIRIMYLGIMGWIGSLITIRGVTIIAHVPPAQTILTQPTATLSQTTAAPATTQPKQQPQPQKPKQEKPKETTKPPTVPEPEIIVIPPEQMVQPAPSPAQTQAQQENQQKQQERN